MPEAQSELCSVYSHVNIVDITEVFMRCNLKTFKSNRQYLSQLSVLQT